MAQKKNSNQKGNQMKFIQAYLVFCLFFSALLTAHSCGRNTRFDPPQANHKELPRLNYGPIGTFMLPPEDMRGNASLVVHFVEPELLQTYCGHGAAACYWNFTNSIIMPNPCHTDYYTQEQASYAATLCHEIGHHNGWEHKDN